MPENSKILPLHVTNTINAKTNVVSLVVSNTDSLYYYMLPLLDNSNMYTLNEFSPVNQFFYK